MLTLKRPYSGRIITGVAIGFAERYRVPVTLVRLFLVASVLGSPVMLLLYLLLSLSIPDERKVASELREWEPKAGLLPRERFEHMAKTLVHRLTPRPSRSGSNTAIAILLLVFGAILELPHVEGTAFYWSHPFLTNIAAGVAWVAPVVLYLSAASFFVFRWRAKSTEIIWRVEPCDRFRPDHRGANMLGGIAAGLSRVLGLDAAYIRVLWTVLNILTLGVAGLLYLLLWYLDKSRPHKPWIAQQKVETALSPQRANRSQRRSGALFRLLIAALLVLLGAIYIATQTRLFFFNQQFFEGAVFVVMGISMVWRGAESVGDRNIAWLVVGASVFLSGIYFFASAIGHIQLDSIDRFEIAEIIAAISLAYLAFASLSSHARMLALLCALTIAAGAAMIAFHITPPEYLAAIIRFYEFFYPIIFAALGLWITFEA